MPTTRVDFFSCPFTEGPNLNSARLGKHSSTVTEVAVRFLAEICLSPKFTRGPSTQLRCF